MNKMIETMKKAFPEYVIMFGKGTFYNVYGRDCSIMNYLFGYKIKEVGKDTTCGFPKNSLNKVRVTLEKKGINYIVIDRTHNYEEEDKYETKDNKYEEVYGTACKYISLKKRLDDVSKYCLSNLENVKVLEIINFNPLLSS